MKKGFTLVELLAVIVILAIIALIATPIILGIINDAKKQSDERSVELYVKGLELAIGRKNLIKLFSPSRCVVINGDAVCDNELLRIEVENADNINGIVTFNSNGKIETNTLVVDDISLSQVYKPQFYVWNEGIIGNTFLENKTLNPSTLEHNFYVGLDLSGEIVSAAYVCFTKDNNEYCLKGNDPAAYEINKNIMKKSFGEDNCTFNRDDFDCVIDDMEVYAINSGYVFIDNGPSDCSSGDDNTFQCNED